MKPLVYKKSRRERGAVPERHKLHVAKGDTVVVIAGKDKGAKGKVIQATPSASGCWSKV